MAAAPAERCALVLHTSGTMGTRKVVPHTLESVVAVADQRPSPRGERAPANSGAVAVERAPAITRDPLGLLTRLLVYSSACSLVCQGAVCIASTYALTHRDVCLCAIPPRH